MGGHHQAAFAVVKCKVAASQLGINAKESHVAARLIDVNTAAVPHIAGIMPGTLNENGCTVWTSDTGGRFYNEVFCLTAVGE